MIDVTVIGFGSVGSALSLLLLNNRHEMRINILEPNSDKEGAILDLLHGMTLYANKELHVNDYGLFRNANFIFYSAGTPNIHGGSRLSTAKQNIELTKSIFEGRQFDNAPYIIVITNPVDIVAHSVMKYTNLPPNHVIGTGTLLDSVRLSYYLSTLSEYHADTIKAYVLGEHGDSQFAAYSMTKVNQKSISTFNNFTPELLDDAEELTRNAAFKIRETQKGTLYGISKCAETFLNALLSDEVQTFPLSMPTNAYYNKLLHLDESIYISVPAQISNKGIQVVDGIQINDRELKAYRESAQIIAQALAETEFD